MKLDQNQFSGSIYSELKSLIINREDIFLHDCYNQLNLNHGGGTFNGLLNVTLNEIEEYYKTFYHPSNSMIFTCGDINLDFNFETIDSVLSNFKHQEIDTTQTIKILNDRLISFSQYQELEKVEEEKMRNLSIVGFNYLLSTQNDYLENLFINRYLFDINGPFFESIFYSQLSTSYTTNSGYEMLTNNHDRLLFGFNDVQNVDELESEFNKTLSSIIDEKSLNVDLFENTINTMR